METKERKGLKEDEKMSEISFGIKSVIINSVKEKMRTIGAESNNLMRNTQEKMSSLLVAAGSNSMLNNTSTKLKEMVGHMQEKLKEIGAAENMMSSNRRAKMKDCEEETLIRIKNLEENLKEVVKTVERIGRSIVSPPDMQLRIRTAREKLQLHALYFVMGLILLVSLWFCCRCFRYCGRMRAVKMMKAPGRNFRMPRANFKANPRSYFRNLHSVKPKFG